MLKLVILFILGYPKTSSLVLSKMSNLAKKQHVFTWYPTIYTTCSGLYTVQNFNFRVTVFLLYPIYVLCIWHTAVEGWVYCHFPPGFVCLSLSRNKATFPGKMECHANIRRNSSGLSCIWVGQSIHPKGSVCVCVCVCVRVCVCGERTICTW